MVFSDYQSTHHVPLLVPKGRHIVAQGKARDERNPGYRHTIVEAPAGRHGSLRCLKCLFDEMTKICDTDRHVSLAWNLESGEK